MASLRAELGGAIGILLVIYALQVQRGVSDQMITIWIDNAEVLDRAQKWEAGDNIKDHLVLDYDLWQSLMSIQKLIHIPLKWEKVDSHIEGKVFKEVVEPKGDEYSIRLNTVADEWAGNARKAHTGIYPQFLYPEGVVMVEKGDGTLINGDIGKVMTESITRDPMIKFLMGKNPHWDVDIFQSIDWRAMEACMKVLSKRSGSTVTNVLKLVHGWQNDGQQKELFYEECEDSMCPAGCGAHESRIHFIQCTAKHLQAGHIKRREEFKRAHGKLKTAKVVYQAMMRIFNSLRCGDAPPSVLSYFASDIDIEVQKAWTEQKKIGWDQILKGRLSKHWGRAQSLYYAHNPETRGNLGFSGTLWAAATVQSLLKFSLALWNDRCDSLHGVDEEDAKRILKAKTMVRVKQLVDSKDDIDEAYSDLFKTQ